MREFFEDSFLIIGPIALLALVFSPIWITMIVTNL